jgi:hypothetical protein
LYFIELLGSLKEEHSFKEATVEHNPVIESYNLPEVYHLGYNGTHFEICLNPTYWDKYIRLAGAGTPYATKMGPTYIPPSIFGGKFGFYGCATVINTPEGFSCIRIPALTEKGEQDLKMSLHTFGATLSSVLFCLNHLLYLAHDAKEKAMPGENFQLFAVRTHVGHNPAFHKVNLSLATSLLSIEFLTRFGSEYSFLDTTEEMEDHYITQVARDGEVVRLLPRAVECHFYNYGALFFRTIGGERVTLEVLPEDFSNKMRCLSGRNVETVLQQFNLLVGVASVWQLVRDGIRLGELPTFS